MAGQFEHIVTKITEKEKNRPQEIALNEIKSVYDSFSTIELYPIKRLIISYHYLSDLAIDFPLLPEDVLFESSDKSTKNCRIHTQLKVLERILNLPDDIPSVIDHKTLIILNVYGYRSHHCKGRLYGQRNIMTLISRQYIYYLFKDRYYDINIKNAHP